MDKIIIDTNILFSILIGKNKVLRDALFLRKHTTYYCCRFAIVELFKYKERILKYSLYIENEFLEALHQILLRIIFFDEASITYDSRVKASQLCKDIDEKDIPFVALTIEVNGLLWTKDKKLKLGLKEKGFNSFFELE